MAVPGLAAGISGTSSAGWTTDLGEITHLVGGGGIGFNSRGQIAMTVRIAGGPPNPDAPYAYRTVEGTVRDSNRRCVHLRFPYRPSAQDP